MATHSSSRRSVSLPARKKQRFESSPVDITFAAAELEDSSVFDDAVHFEDTPEDWLASAVSLLLSQKCDRNDSNAFRPTPEQAIGIFFSSIRLPFAVDSYVLRLVTYMDCSKAAFVCALIYLDRLVRIDPRFRITVYNVHRLILTATVIATKFLDDSVYKNTHYAYVGGISQIAEMNRLEKEMLRLLEYRVSVDAAEFRYFERVLFSELVIE